MRIFQIIYTSQKRQPLMNSDIEMSGTSPGISDDDKQETRDLFASLLSCVPGDFNDISSYAFCRLKSSRYFICHMDTADDIGKIILHGLVLEDGHWPFYPAQIVDSAVFSNNYDMHTDGFIELPVLTELPLGHSLTYDGISLFLKSRPDHGYEDMLCGAVSYKNTQKPVIILDQRKNLIHWIAAVQMAFPIDMAHDITFCTSATGLSGFMMRCSSYGDSASLKLGEDNYIFDYRVGIKSSFAVRPGFLKIVNTGFTVSKAVLDSFHKFINMLGYKELDEDVDGCYHLFALCNFKGVNMSYGELISSFRFALVHTPEEMLEDIFRMLEPSMARVVGASDLHLAGMCAEFMFKAVHISKKTVFIERANYFFYCMIDHIMLEGHEIDIDGVVQLYLEIADLNRGRTKLFYKYSLEGERLEFINSKLNQDCSPQKSMLYLYIMLVSSLELGYYWSQMMSSDKAALVVDSCIKHISQSVQDILNIMEAVAANDEYLSRITVMFYNRISSAAVMDRFISQFVHIMDQKDEEQRLSVRREIMKPGCGRLLFDEYQMRLALSGDKALFFNEYMHNVFDKISEFSKQYISDAVKLYAQKLPFEHTCSESVRLAEYVADNSLVLDEDALSCLINAFEGSQAMAPPSDEVRKILPEIKRIKKNSGIMTKPDITSMLDFGIWLESCSPSQPVDDILYERFDIGMLDDKRYTGYINWCIQHIIPHASNPEEFKKVIRFLNKDGMDLELHIACIRSIFHIISTDTEKGFHLLLQFSVYYFFYLEPWCKVVEDETLPENMKTSLITVLSGQSPAFIKRFDAAIGQEFIGRGLSLPVQWSLIYSEVAAKVAQPAKKGFLSFFRRPR